MGPGGDFAGATVIHTDQSASDDLASDVATSNIDRDGSPRLTVLASEHAEGDRAPEGE